MRHLLLCSLFAFPVFLIAAEKEGKWEELLQPGNTDIWRTVDEKWILTNDAKLNPEKPRQFIAEPVDNGSIWVNGETGRVKNLITKKEYRDCEVMLDFIMGQRSNSGIKFQAVYEIQLLDSAGKPDDQLTGNDSGGIYPRGENKMGYRRIDDGIPPKTNAAKPAGEWQTLHAIFRSPRFDKDGNKIENAKIVKAVLNGKVIHENQELKHPTGANWVLKEKPVGPFMIQADHGPIAIRNVKIREIEE